MIPNNIKLVYVSSSTCNPCKTFGPMLDKAAHELDLPIKKLIADAEGNEHVTDEYKVTGVPTVIVYRDGVEVARNVGALLKPKLIQWLQKVA